MSRDFQSASDAYFREADQIQAELIEQGVHPWDAIERSHKIIRERRQRRRFDGTLPGQSGKEKTNDA